MNETTADRLEAASATGFNTEFNGAAMKAALDAASVTEVTKPLSEPATMECKSETAPWELHETVQTYADINP